MSDNFGQDKSKLSGFLERVKGQQQQEKSAMVERAMADTTSVPQKKTYFQKFKENRAVRSSEKAAENEIYKQEYQSQYRVAREKHLRTQAAEAAQRKAAGGTGFTGMLGGISTGLSSVSKSVEGSGLGGTVSRGGFLGDPFSYSKPTKKKSQDQFGFGAALGDVFTYEGGAKRSVKHRHKKHLSTHKKGKKTSGKSITIHFG